MLCYSKLQVWYVTLALERYYAVEWMKQTKKLFTLSMDVLRTVEVMLVN